jgi:hypothetical protein
MKCQRERVCLFVRDHPGATVLQVARALGLSDYRAGPHLVAEVKAGRMVREKGCGPRGGFGYFVSCRRHEDCREHPQTLGLACFYRSQQATLEEWAQQMGLATWRVCARCE